MNVLTMNQAQALAKPALSTDHYREVLTGYAISRSKERAWLVATDTHRMHVCEIDPAFATCEPDSTLAYAGGQYPDWQRVMPDAHTREAIVSCEALALALKTLAPIARKSANRVRLCFNGNTLKVRARVEELAEAEVTLGGEFDNLVDFEVAFNATYLLETFKEWKTVSGSERAILRFTENSKPATLHFESLGDAYRAVIMPMALA